MPSLLGRHACHPPTGTPLALPCLLAPPLPARQVLAKSFLFYESQRSGNISAGSRVPWRRSAHLADRVPGGYYDAGTRRPVCLTLGGRPAAPAAPPHARPQGCGLHGLGLWPSAELAARRAAAVPACLPCAALPCSAGDYLKISYTTAHATLMLAWGALDFAGGMARGEA